MLLNYSVSGSGEPIIILHGLFGSLDNWSSVARKLATIYRTFTVDQRNHGKSFHSDSFSYENMAYDIESLIQYYNLNSVTLIGHSMGGKTAMKFAFMYPESVKRLIVVDIAPKNYPPLYKEIIETLLKLDISKISRLRQAEEQLRTKIPDENLRFFLLKNLNKDNGGHYSWKLNLKAIRDSYAKLSTGITGKPFERPCLFIRGENSDYILDEDWNGIKQYFPKAEIRTIPGAGHWVHVEAEDAFVKMVVDYIGEGVDEYGNPRIQYARGPILRGESFLGQGGRGHPGDGYG